MADLIQHDGLRAMFGPEMPIIAVPDSLVVPENGAGVLFIYEEGMM